GVARRRETGAWGFSEKPNGGAAPTKTRSPPVFWRFPARMRREDSGGKCQTPPPPAPSRRSNRDSSSVMTVFRLLNPSSYPATCARALLVAHPPVGSHKTTLSDERSHDGRAVVITLMHARRR